MAKTKTPKFITGLRTGLSKYGPEILTGIGVAGLITTTVLAVRSTPKALKTLEEEKKIRAKEEKIPVEEVKISPVDTVKLCWKCYIPSAIAGTTSIACIIGASSANVRRKAALATAYKLSETALIEYRDKVIETIGEKKEKAVREKVSEEQLKNNPVGSKEVIIAGNGDSLFFEPLTSRYFVSNIETVKRAENNLNKRMLHDITGYASLNEFYDEIDLPRTDVGELMGWNTENLIDIDFDAHKTEDGRASLVIYYNNRPQYNYEF